ncbi:MAG: antitoxin family protein [Phycisphaerales bacterium]|nr:antitoxin family protein [Phycisphaerales bacterium]
MLRTVEAIYADGVLKLVERLPLRENERVRVSVERIDEASANRDRAEAVERFRAGVAASQLKTVGPLPSREELHEPG